MTSNEKCVVLCSKVKWRLILVVFQIDQSTQLNKALDCFQVAIATCVMYRTATEYVSLIKETLNVELRRRKTYSEKLRKRVGARFDTFGISGVKLSRFPPLRTMWCRMLRKH